MKTDTTKTREELFQEMAKSYSVCHSQSCPIRQHCLRSILSSYVPGNYPVVTCINLLNPRMQSDDCPQYRPAEPVRMPLGLKRMYYDMPGHLERSIKAHLINLLSRKGYYKYHSARRPVTPDIEQLIRQTLRAFGWTQEPAFDDYVEEYLW